MLGLRGKGLKMGKVKLHAGLVMSYTVVLHSLNYEVSAGFPFLLLFSIRRVMALNGFFRKMTELTENILFYSRQVRHQ